MGKIKEIISPSLFIVAIICFVLPFVNISCGGETATISGVDLAKGFEIFGEKVEPNLLAIVAIIVALIGAVMFLIKNTTARIVQVVVGVVGAVALIALKILFEQKVTEGGAPVGISWLAGYYISLMAMIGGSVSSLITVLSGNNPVPAASTVNSRAGGVICPKCNKMNEAGNNWCRWCGTNIKDGQPRPIDTPVPQFVPPKSTPDVSIAESVTMPLQAESVPVFDDQPVAFLRTQRIGRWELIPILKNDFVIGSDPNSTDYQEKSGNLGKIHAIIEKINGSYRISDTNNDCTIYINNQKLIGKTYSLNSGDVIRLNSIEYIFDIA